MHRRSFPAHFAVILLTAAALAGCAGSLSGAPPPPEDPVGTLRFLESYPEETTLDLPSLDQAYEVWPLVMAQAKESLNVASFYFSRQGDGQDASAPAGVVDRLAPILQGLPQAGQRGCRVRVLGDGKFFDTYPEALNWLDQQPGVAARHLDARGHWGGVMHAKYFVADDQVLYVGSQNWDWRALTQIHELGALVNHPRLAGQLRRIFDMDWDLAGTPPPSLAPDGRASGAGQPAHRWDDFQPALLTTAAGDTVQALLAASPPQVLPQDVPWDLPLLVSNIDAATSRVRVQLLSYGVTDRQGNLWATLDTALRRAAARKVEVQIILSNWAKARYSLPWIQSLAAVPHVQIKYSNIPEHSAGFVPFARVEHAKFMTVDGQSGWIGTSNWSEDYFFKSRNISLFLRGAGAMEQLDTFFETSWEGPYCETVDPCGDYSPPRRN